MKLSSCPPSFRTMFRREKIVPKISLASSWADRRAGRARAGPLSSTATLVVLVFDVGRGVLLG